MYDCCRYVSDDVELGSMNGMQGWQASVGVNYLVCGSCYIGKLFIAGEHIRCVSGMEEWCEKVLMSWYECLCRG